MSAMETTGSASFAPYRAGTSDIASRWTDPVWLDALRKYGDEPADRCAAALKASGVPSQVTRRVLAQMKGNSRHLPDDAPAPLKEFFEQTYGFCAGCGTPSLPAWVDRDRILRGQQAFMTRSLPSVLVMLCKSLPEGYAAPAMAKVLNLSGDLKAKPYHRLMGTLQLLMDVTAPYSFERMGMALIAGQEMRLLHAGVRTNVAPVVMGAHEYDAFVTKYGTPINQEDMAGTIIGFSLLVVQGLQTLGLPFSDQDAEDYYYVWRVFAHLMGVRAPGLADDADGMPPTLADAAAFYEVYKKRHYVGPTRYVQGWREEATRINPDGVELTVAHIRMLGRFVAAQYAHGRAAQADESDATSLLGRMAESAGIHAAERYVHLLVGDEGSARIGVAQNHWTDLMDDALKHVPAWWEKLWDRVDKNVHIEASEWLFQKLVGDTYRAGVVFPVPLSVSDLHHLAAEGQ